jgi:hypothetical protein
MAMDRALYAFVPVYTSSLSACLKGALMIGSLSETCLLFMEFNSEDESGQLFEFTRNDWGLAYRVCLMHQAAFDGLPSRVWNTWRTSQDVLG